MDILPLTPGLPKVKKCSPHHGDRRKADFSTRLSTFGPDIHDLKGSRKTFDGTYVCVKLSWDKFGGELICNPTR